MKLGMVLTKLCGGTTLALDKRVYVWHEHGHLTLVMSTHVDDFKGTGRPEVAKRLIAILQTEFGTIKVQWNTFQHVGVMHEKSRQQHRAASSCSESKDCYVCTRLGVSLCKHCISSSKHCTSSCKHCISWCKHCISS